MAAELQIPYTKTGATLYAIVRDTTGQVWDTVGGSFGAYATGSIGNYDIAFSEQGTASQFYTATFPASISAGRYYVTVFEQAGGSPAEADTLVGHDRIDWDGSAVYEPPTSASSGTFTADVTKWNGTAVATPDTAGYPVVTIKDGTGQGELNITSGVVDANAVQVSGDSTAADNLESDYDGTGYDKTASSVGAIRVNTAQAGAAGTITLDASASATNDLYNGALITIRSGTGAGQSRWIYDYVGSTKVASVSRDWTTNPSSDSVFVILPSSHPLLDDIADLDDFTASAAAKLALITSGTSINIQSTITDGDVFTILQGETRDFTDGNHIRIDVDGTVTDLTGYTPKFAFTKLTSNSGTSSLELSGTVVNAGLSTQYIYFEMTEAQTEALALDTSATHPYRLSSNYAYRWDASSTDGVSNCPGHGTGYVSVKAMATTC